MHTPRPCLCVFNATCVNCQGHTPRIQVSVNDQGGSKNEFTYYVRDFHNNDQMFDLCNSKPPRAPPDGLIVRWGSLFV